MARENSSPWGMALSVESLPLQYPVPGYARDKSLFLPLDTNEIGVKYEQREPVRTVVLPGEKGVQSCNQLERGMGLCGCGIRAVITLKDSTQGCK